MYAVTMCLLLHVKQKRLKEYQYLNMETHGKQAIVFNVFPKIY